MDIYAAITRKGEDARRHEKAKGYGDDEVYGGGWCPTRECIKCMGGKAELFNSYLFDRYCTGSTALMSHMDRRVYLLSTSSVLFQ